ncbi:ankyrin repeat-containing protein [Fusarium mundagurra]|uniref:Ankyrin repeat-containing protein n=1 Tax=Fusarium mundagurra TaxID=1567541 RepID=A0A8H5XUM9_9HYPO|nr:ankyrin repeat-containing protein [Fusarium mundagurra]
MYQDLIREVIGTVDRCWYEVLMYLVRQGAVLEPLDHRSSLPNTSWPHVMEALGYAFPSAEQNGFATACFNGIPIRGQTPLYIAAYMNETTEEAMKLLLDHGADPNDGGSKGYPPLVRALEDSSLDKFMFLLANGAKPSVRHADRSILTIVLELPDTLVVLKYQLVRHLVVVLGVDVYESATRTSPALRVGTAQGCLPGYKELILDILTDSIPEPYLQDQLNDALEFCCADPRVARQGFNNLLHLICADRDRSDHEHHNDMAALLGEGSLDINAAGNGGSRPLHLAIHQMKRDFVLLLLEHGATADVDDDHRMTPLQALCSNPCPEYDLTYSSAEIDSSLDDPYYQGKRGEAAFKFDLRTARMEVKTSLQQEEIVQALLHHGADPFKTDASGRNALLLACENGNTVLVAGTLYWLHQSSAVLAETALEATDNEGNSCLHIAAAGGHSRTIKVLLGSQHLRQPVRNEWRDQTIRDEESSRSDLFTNNQNMQRQEKDYAKAHAAPSFFRDSSIIFTQPHVDVKFTIGSERRMTEESITLPNVSVSEWRLTRLTITNETAKLIAQANMQGKTPLHCAAQNGHLDTVELLLDTTDADVAATDTQGKTAAYLALENTYFDIYHALQILK